MPQPPFNIAHRGASKLAPENTMPALQLAVDQGADGLELDIHRTLDGVPVVLHDPTLERTTDHTGPVADVSHTELDEVDAGFHFLDADGRRSFRGRGVRVPTLREVLETFPQTWLSLDLKAGDPITESNVVALLREYEASDRVVLGAEDASAGARLRGLAPEIPAFFHRGEVTRFVLRERFGIWWNYRAPAASLQIPLRGGGLGLDRRSLIDRAHALGVAVRYWTINDPADMHRLLDLGADGLISDRPDRVHTVLAERAHR